MKLNARIGSKEHEVAIERQDAFFCVTVDGEEFLADARPLFAHYYSIIMKGRSYAVTVEPQGDAYTVRHGASRLVVTLTDPSRRARESGLGERKGPVSVLSVMPGKVVRVLVHVGDEVQAGQGLVVVEAMKMENEIGAPKAGKVVVIEAEAGKAVEAGGVLVVVE